MKDMKEMKEIVKFEDCYIGMVVEDDEGGIGIIKECDDIHNILVDYGENCSGLHCLIEDCGCNTINEKGYEINHYDPLYYHK